MGNPLSFPYVDLSRVLPNVQSRLDGLEPAVQTSFCSSLGHMYVLRITHQVERSGYALKNVALGTLVSPILVCLPLVRSPFPGGRAGIPVQVFASILLHYLSGYEYFLFHCKPCH